MAFWYKPASQALWQFVWDQTTKILWVSKFYKQGVLVTNTESSHQEMSKTTNMFKEEISIWGAFRPQQSNSLLRYFDNASGFVFFNKKMFAWTWDENSPKLKESNPRTFSGSQLFIATSPLSCANFWSYFIWIVWSEGGFSLISCYYFLNQVCCVLPPTVFIHTTLLQSQTLHCVSSPISILWNGIDLSQTLFAH